MFERYERDGITLGYWYRIGRAFYFFGTRQLTREVLQLEFPKLQFRFLKQVHGARIVVSRASAPPEADGHFTRETGVALVSQTADCVPVLLGNQHFVCALHAGWKGLARNIVGAARNGLEAEGAPDFLAIGPHISRSSFEVGRDVANQLIAAAPMNRDDGLVELHPEPAKVFFDLGELAARQLRAAFGSEPQIGVCDHDTKTNFEFHSFRRDKVQAGRQYSFVTLV